MLFPNQENRKINSDFVLHCSNFKEIVSFSSYWNIILNKIFCFICSIIIFLIIFPDKWPWAKLHTKLFNKLRIFHRIFFITYNEFYVNCRHISCEPSDAANSWRKSRYGNLPDTAYCSRAAGYRLQCLSGKLTISFKFTSHSMPITYYITMLKSIFRWLNLHQMYLENPSSR